MQQGAHEAQSSGKPGIMGYCLDYRCLSKDKLNVNLFQKHINNPSFLRNHEPEKIHSGTLQESS
jgi:hypothetical protein